MCTYMYIQAYSCGRNETRYLSYQWDFKPNGSDHFDTEVQYHDNWQVRAWSHSGGSLKQEIGRGNRKACVMVGCLSEGGLKWPM